MYKRAGYIAPRPFADPFAAARKLLEIANAVETLQDGRIHIEKINGPFLFKEGGTPGGVHRRARPRRRQWLAVEARVRNLREVHASRCGVVRVTMRAPDGPCHCRKLNPASK